MLKIDDKQGLWTFSCDECGFSCKVKRRVEMRSSTVMNAVICEIRCAGWRITVNHDRRIADALWLHLCPACAAGNDLDDV